MFVGRCLRSYSLLVVGVNPLAMVLLGIFMLLFISIEQCRCQTPACFLQLLYILYSLSPVLNLDSFVNKCPQESLFQCFMSLVAQDIWKNTVLGKHPLQSLKACRCSLYTVRPVTTSTATNLTPLCSQSLCVQDKIEISKLLCKT